MDKNFSLYCTFAFQEVCVSVVTHQSAGVCADPHKSV